MLFDMVVLPFLVSINFTIAYFGNKGTLFVVQFDLSQYAPGVVKHQAEVYNAVSNSTYQTSDDKLQQRKRNPQNCRMTKL